MSRSAHCATLSYLRMYHEIGHKRPPRVPRISRTQKYTKIATKKNGTDNSIPRHCNQTEFNRNLYNVNNGFKQNAPTYV